MDPTAVIAFVAACAPLVDAGTARALISVESSFNANAIGIVGGVLERQPRNRAEALATTKSLRANGWNFSVGLAQINVRNFARLGLTAESALDPCSNLTAMQSVLRGCFERATLRANTPQRSLRQALSCYYSGNFVTGFRDGYVSRVVHAATPSAARPASNLPRAKEST